MTDKLTDEVLTGLTFAPPADPDRLDRSRIDWPTFWTRERNVSDWLVDPVLPAGRGVAIYSPAGTGKSLLSLDLSARVATGARCLNQPAGHPRHVLYVDLEMTEDDLQERLEDMGYGPATDLSFLHYYLLPDLSPLDTPTGGLELTELAQRHQADLAVIDTTTRTLVGNENDADTIRNFWRYTGSRLKADGRTLLRNDHAGKDSDRGQRGSSAKNDDVDIVWELTASESGLRLKAKKRRLRWVPELVDLVVIDDPTRHERATEWWPAGTAEVAARLDALDAALDLGGRSAGAILRDNGAAVRNEVVYAALRYRRHDTYRPRGAPSGAHPDDTPWERDGNTPTSPLLTSGERVGEHSEHPPPAKRGAAPPPKGGCASQAQPEDMTSPPENAR
jgi:hypothetical protein